MNDLFGEIRSILSRPPDATRWRHLCQLVDDASDHRAIITQALPYIIAHLPPWPEQMRVASPDAHRRLLEEEHIPPSLAMCTHINLSHNAMVSSKRLTTNRLCQLADSSLFLASATRLDLRGQPIGNHALHTLADSPHFAHLHTLHLDNTCVDLRGLEQALPTLPIAPCVLEHLTLSHLKLPDDAFTLLFERGYLHQLTHLDLSHNELSDRALSLTLPRLDRPLALTTLRLAFNKLTDQSATLLAASTHIPHLTHLDLDYNLITGHGARTLSHSPHLWHTDILC